mgnify:CR=1 FL=1
MKIIQFLSEIRNGVEKIQKIRFSNFFEIMVDWSDAWDEGELDVLSELQDKSSPYNRPNDYIDSITEPHNYTAETDDDETEESEDETPPSKVRKKNQISMQSLHT